MSKLFTQNKQLMVHIVSEVVVVVGLAFYFNQKNKKLLAHIEDLAQRVEEQEDLLQKHDQMLRKVFDHINQQQMQQKVKAIPTLPPVNREKPKFRPKHKPRKKPVSVLKKPSVRVSFAADPVSKVSDSDTGSSSEDESDLDAEIAEELGELLGEGKDNLKKQGLVNKDA